MCTLDSYGRFGNSFFIFILAAVISCCCNVFLALIPTSSAGLSKMWLGTSRPLKKISRRITVFFLLIITSCVTPIGKFKESDFVWEEKVITANYQEVYRRILLGFRRCKVGVPESNLYQDIKEGRFDVYLDQAFVGGRSDITLGMIYVVYKTNDISIVKVGVRYIFDKPLFGEEGGKRRLWLKWAAGNINCP